MSVTTLLTVLALAAGDPCAAPRGDSCTPRNGHCFDLAIDGQPVQRLSDAALAARLDQAVAQPVCWFLPQPASGALAAHAGANARTATTLGALHDELEIVVTALEGQTIPTRKGIRTDPTVRIGGVPMQTAVDVIDTEALPGGAYVMSFRVRGPGGWDRKAVYVEVRREGD